MRFRKTENVICKTCGEYFMKRSDGIKNWSGNCKKCSSKLISRARKPKPRCIECHKELMQLRKTKRCLKCSIKFRSGKNHYKWINDRSLVKRQEERNNPRDKFWKYSVYKRDNYKCRINNNDCLGNIEAHHILSWRDYPDLRFDINNGITLCKFHHPRKRCDELLLLPYFIKLISIFK